MALLSWLDFLFHSSSILMTVPCFDLFPVVVTATDFEITISRFSIPATLISRLKAQFSPALFSQTRTVRCHPACQQDCILFVDIKRLTQVPSIQNSGASLFSVRRAHFFFVDLLPVKRLTRL